MAKNKYIIYRDREAALAPTYWVALSVCSDLAGRAYGIKPVSTWNLFSRGRIIVYYRQQEVREAREKIGELFFSNKNYFLKIKEEMVGAEKILRRLIKKIKNLEFNKLEEKQLIDLALSIVPEYQKYEAINIYAWFFGSENLLEKIKKIINISESEFLFLATPFIKTVVNQIEDNLLLQADKIYRGKTTIEESACILSEKYGAIPHGWNGPDYWDVDYFKEKLIKILSDGGEKIANQLADIKQAERRSAENIKKIINKYKISEKNLNLLERLRQITIWTDERRILTFEVYYHYHLILEELARRFNFSFFDLKYLFTEELPLLLEDQVTAGKISAFRRTEDFIVAHENSQMRVLGGLEVAEFLSAVEMIGGDDFLRGKVASRGNQEIYRGRVKVLLSPKDCYKVEVGDFVVATMTTPDYIVAMKKASGFITDEGGVTCHAAITAREMGKPCIIATGNATKILKDGDLAELDMKDGTIKILN